MPEEENNNSREKDKHAELTSWLLRGAVSILALGMWYVTEMAIDTKDAFIAFKAQTDLKISNEIGRSKKEDEGMQKEIDKNTASREDNTDHDSLVTLMERTKNLHSNDGEKRDGRSSD